MAPFSSVWARWKAVARAIGVFQTRLILTLFYFLFLWPFALMLGRRRFSRAHPAAGTAWTPREGKDRAMADLSRQS
jgi:hypothetical protein